MAVKKSLSASKRATPNATGAAAATADRVSVAHGPYLIVAGRRDEACAAVGYLGRKRIAATTADTVDAAVSAMIGTLDERTSGLRSARTGAVPTESEFREALGALYPKLSKRVRAMLSAHCRQPGAAMSLVDLARRFEVSETTAKTDYGKLARGLTGLLAFAPADEAPDRKLVPLLSIATITLSGSGRPVLHLRPELVAALRARQQLDA